MEGLEGIHVYNCSGLVASGCLTGPECKNEWCKTNMFNFVLFTDTFSSSLLV